MSEISEIVRPPRPSLPVVPDYRRYYPTGHGVLLLELIVFTPSILG